MQSRICSRMSGRRRLLRSCCLGAGALLVNGDDHEHLAAGAEARVTAADDGQAAEPSHRVAVAHRRPRSRSASCVRARVAPIHFSLHTAIARVHVHACAGPEQSRYYHRSPPAGFALLPGAGACLYVLVVRCGAGDRNLRAGRAPGPVLFCWWCDARSFSKPAWRTVLAGVLMHVLRVACQRVQRSSTSGEHVSR